MPLSSVSSLRFRPRSFHRSFSFPPTCLYIPTPRRSLSLRFSVCFPPPVPLLSRLSSNGPVPHFQTPDNRGRVSRNQYGILLISMPGGFSTLSVPFGHSSGPRSIHCHGRVSWIAVKSREEPRHPPLLAAPSFYIETAKEAIRVIDIYRQRFSLGVLVAVDERK